MNKRLKICLFHFLCLIWLEGLFEISVFDSYMFKNPRRSLEFIWKNRIHSGWFGESSIKFTKEDIDEDDKFALENKLQSLLRNELNGNFDVL